MALHIPESFNEFLRLLNKHEVEYLLIGGYAVAFHGYPRATADMDIFIAVNPGNAAKMNSAVREFGFDVPGLSADVFLDTSHGIIRMGVPPLRIEIMLSISGVDFGECFEKKIVFKDGDLVINIIDKESLVINKKAAARHKDLSDLEYLP